MKREPGAGHSGRKPVGLILAGGRASRLGGGDKMLRTIGGRTILSRIVERLTPQCDGLVLSLNGDRGRITDWTWPVVADHPEDAGCGPLAGLLAGLDWAAGHRPDVCTLLTVPADTPFLPDDLVARLARARGHARAIAFARSAGRGHPLAALWPVVLRIPLRAALRGEGVRRVGAVLERHAAVPVEWPAALSDPFLNVNTSEDILAAERRAAGP